MSNNKTIALVGLGLLGGYLFLRPTIYDEFENLNDWNIYSENADPLCTKAEATKDGNLTIAKLTLFGSRCTIKPEAINGINIANKKNTGYGEYSTRLKSGLANSSNNEGVVSSFYIYRYLSSHQMTEIDLELLSIEPDVIHMAMYNKAYHVIDKEINMRTGKVVMAHENWISSENIWTTYDIPTIPTEVETISDFDHTQNYYEYGFNWTPSKVTWWVKSSQGKKIILWEVTNVDYIPTLLPVNNVLDVWHAHTWQQKIFNNPTIDTSAYFDWFKHRRL